MNYDEETYDAIKHRQINKNLVCVHQEIKHTDNDTKNIVLAKYRFNTFSITSFLTFLPYYLI